MSLKMKLVSAITAMILMLGVMLTGILAAQTQTLTMTGNVNFNIADKSLYVKQVRIKQDNNSDPQVVSDFLPGYINSEFNMNIGEYSNSLGSFALYFDIINATDSQWEITRVTLSEQLQADNVSVSYSGIVATNDIAEKDEDGFKIFDPATKEKDGTLILIISAPNSTSINLSGITITIDEYVQVYERVDEEGNPDPNGDYLYFGWYPQTVKAANVTLSDTTDETTGYYVGSDGAYYVQVAASLASYSSGYTFSDGTTIENGHTYYFKVERLKWRILDDNYGDGTALIVCDTIVDVTTYQDNYIVSGLYTYAVNEEGVILTDDKTGAQVYANNYKYSDIRFYLNNTFYNKAFNEKEKKCIVTTEVDNSKESLMSDDNQYICENTYDKVFLLSASDVNNVEYGFKDSSNTTVNDTAYFDFKRAFFPSDLCVASGARIMTQQSVTNAPAAMENAEMYIGSGYVWLRSPLSGSLGNSSYTISTGILSTYAVFTDLGVVPALQIQL